MPHARQASRTAAGLLLVGLAAMLAFVAGLVYALCVLTAEASLARSTATILGVALFGERRGAGGWLGAVLLLSALGLLIVPRR